QDPYHEDDEAKETVDLFSKLDQLLQHVAFLNDELRETMVGVDALVVIAIEEVLKRVEHVADEEFERLRKRKR
ncbi:hypothetical protein Tco_0302210, partial [Tanacetum coccineum]